MRYHFTFVDFPLTGSSGGHKLSGLLDIGITGQSATVNRSTLTTEDGTYSEGTAEADSLRVTLNQPDNPNRFLELSDFILPDAANSFAGYTYNYPGPSVSESDGSGVSWSGAHDKTSFEIVHGVAQLPGTVAPPRWRPTSKLIRPETTSHYEFSVGNVDEAGATEVKFDTKIVDTEKGPDGQVDLDKDGYRIKWISDNCVLVQLDPNDDNGIKLIGAFYNLFFLNSDGVQEIISEVRYNRYESGINDFLGDPYLLKQPDFSDFSEPGVFWDMRSFRFLYSDFKPQLIADHVTHVFEFKTIPIPDALKGREGIDVKMEWWWDQFSAEG